MNAVKVTPTLSILLLSLYFSQGFPAGLMAHVLPAVLREQGVALDYIGLLKFMAIPWVLKFLWAPWIDGRDAPGFSPVDGRQRGWIILMQGLAIAALVLLAHLEISREAALPGTAPIAWFLVLILLLNLAAATQDIATDGLAVKLLSPARRGWGNALQVGGYKVGMVLCASLLLVIVEAWGWRLSLLAMAAVLLLALLPVWRLAPALLRGAGSSTDQSILGNRRLAGARREAAVHHPLRAAWSFVRRPGIRAWLILLVACKVPDGLGSTMIKPLLVDLGWGLGDIGTLTLLTSLVGVAAVFLGGLLYDRLGPNFCLLALAVLQAVAMAAFLPLADGASAPALVFSVCLFEQVVDAIGNVTLFALMMHHCRAGREGADFTVQACLQIVLAGVAAALSGFIASLFSYTVLYALAACCALLIIPLCLDHGRRYPLAQHQWRQARGGN